MSLPHSVHVRVLYVTYFTLVVQRLQQLLAVVLAFGKITQSTPQQLQGILFTLRFSDNMT